MNIFLDLDGTLTDPFEGITKSIVYALEQLGHQAPDRAELGWAIGPALVDSFARLGVQSPEQALAQYRIRYTDVGLFENRLYDGVLETMARLKSDGHALFLMTAKPHAYARKITAHFGIAQFMTQEFGPELDGTRNDKAELLGYALDVLGVGPENSVMVGDRLHDFNAARANSVHSIAVTWGYGDEHEWALADQKCEAVDDLPKVVSRANA